MYRFGYSLALAGVLLGGCRSPVRRAADILTYEEYANLSCSAPYVLELDDSTGALLYYGADHVFDPEHPQNASIQKLWERFRPTRAFNEGGDPPVAESVDEAVARYGEPGLVRYLAARDGVPVQSLEPAPAAEAAAVLSAGIPPDRLKVYFVLRAYKTFRQAKHEESPEEFVDRGVTWTSRVQGLEGPPYSGAELGALYAQLFPNDPDWRVVPGGYFDPTRSDTWLNEIARLTSRARDCHMVDLVAGAAQHGERVFAVVGFSHVVMQEPALKARFTGLRHLPAGGSRAPLKGRGDVPRVQPGCWSVTPAYTMTSSARGT